MKVVINRYSEAALVRDVLTHECGDDGDAAVAVGQGCALPGAN
jgi:hypothetical protein